MLIYIYILKDRYTLPSIIPTKTNKWFSKAITIPNPLKKEKKIIGIAASAPFLLWIVAKSCTSW